MRAKQAELREAGRPRGGVRPFGYLAGMHQVHKAEADALRAAADAVLVGRQPREIAREWNRQGLCTTRGGHWSGASVRRVLTRPRNAAIIEHAGQEYGPGSGLRSWMRTPTRGCGPGWETG